MLKAWFHTSLKNQQGFSPVELLLAVTIFAMIVTAISGALVYGRSATTDAGDHTRATFLAEEGTEVVRNMRDSAYANLTDGTYGLTQSGNQWVLSGSSDTSGIYTRQITISSVDTVRKNVTSTVTWAQGSMTQQVTSTVRLTNWIAATKSWALATLVGSYNASGSNDAIKVATVGNYAYMVRNDGTPDFLILNISNPAAPTLVGSLSLAGIPTNIKVNGNYAYVTNSGDTTELQIINITNPASPVLTATFDASGTGDGLDVGFYGNYAYLVRAAAATLSPELVVVSIANPAAPTLAGSMDNGITQYEIVILGSNAYIAADTDSQELLIVNLIAPTVPVALSLYDLPGTTDATTISGYGNTVLIGQGATLYRIDVSSPAFPALMNSVTMTGTGVIKDVDQNTTNGYAYIGTTSTTGEFQVISIGSTASMSVAKVIDVAGTASTIGGVAYNSGLDVVVGASASDTTEAVIFKSN